MRATAKLGMLLPLVALVVAGAFVLSGCERGVLAPPTLEPLIVRTDGPWLRDRMGRVVLVRGINFSPADQARLLALSEAERTRVFDAIGALGFNALRVQLSWGLLEPTPFGLERSLFAERIDLLLRLATGQGMVVILTLRVGGRSAPPWTFALSGNAPLDPRAAWAPLSCDLFPPSDAASGPAEQRDATARASEEGATAAPPPRRRRTSLGQRIVRTWQRIADRYAYDVRIFGLDLLDQPFAGCPTTPTSSAQLGHLYAEVAAKVRARHSEQTLLVEPSLVPGSPLPERAAALPPPVAYAPQAILTAPPAARSAPDEYTAEQEMEAVIAQQTARAEKLELALVIGEIGATPPAQEASPSPGGTANAGAVPYDDERGRALTPALIRAANAQLDDRLAAGLFASGAGALTARPDAPLDQGLREAREALAHPYARRIAGSPTALAFDPPSATLALSFRDDEEVNPPDPSEIFLPRHIFPGDIDVEVSGAGSWRYEPELHRLLVYRGSGTEHEVRVRPRQASGAAAPRE